MRPDIFEEVHREYAEAVERGAYPILEPTTEAWRAL